ncbi:MAG: hypothetical protein N2745_00895 [Syntrophorhabdaceae bacterium]|nr:hypothetical protein [Syntrophorhabdaceae bacterium]
MSEFIRIKGYIINMKALTYISVRENHIDFVFPADRPEGQGLLRVERGVDLKDSEFNEVKEFVLNLPDADRVIVV